MELIAGNEVWWKTGLEGSAVTVGRERVVLVQRDGRSGFGVGRFVVKIERAFGWIASAWADFFSEERGFSGVRVRRKWLSMNADVAGLSGAAYAVRA